MTKTSRGASAVTWIERYCIVPTGPQRGQHVRLSQIQRETVCRIYDDPQGSEAVPLSGPLASYLGLMHVAGPEALQRAFVPKVEVDIFTTWGAVSPDLREVLRLEHGQITCPELGTKFPAAA